jgi:Putative zincin peptidase
MFRANALAILVTAPPVLGLAAVFAARWGWALAGRGVNEFLTLPVGVPLAVGGILVHEAVHAITWAIASGRPLSAIEIGIQWRSLSPFAHPRAPMAARPYRIGAAMPGVVLGLIPAVLAVILGTPLLLIFGLFFLIAAGGDALVLWLIRDVSSGLLVQDHPTRAGCIVVE